jgi:hypothetical protein
VFPVYVLADDRCVHDGEDPGPAGSSLVPPL